MKHFCFFLYFLLFSQLTVFSQNVAVEVEKMNILWKFAPNPIKIVVQDVPCEKVVVKTKVGTLTHSSDKDSCHYFYWSKDCIAKQEQFTIGIKNDGKIKWIDSLEYRLIDDAKKSIFINVNGCMSNCIRNKESFEDDVSLTGIDYIHKITATLINFDIDLNYKVSKYSVELTRNDLIIYSEKDILQDTFSKKLLQNIKNAEPNDKIRFYDVIVSFDNCEEKYEGPTITIK